MDWEDYHFPPTEQEKMVLLFELGEFLDSPVPSNRGGWAPVSEDDWKKLTDFIEWIIAFKWGPDLDGDLPIETHLTNRNVHENHPYINVPYLCHAETRNAVLEHIDCCMVNASIATDRLDIALKQLRCGWLEKYFDEKRGE